MVRLTCYLDTGTNPAVEIGETFNDTLFVARNVDFTQNVSADELALVLTHPQTFLVFSPTVTWPRSKLISESKRVTALTPLIFLR